MPAHYENPIFALIQRNLDKFRRLSKFKENRKGMFFYLKPGQFTFIENKKEYTCSEQHFSIFRTCEYKIKSNCFSGCHCTFVFKHRQQKLTTHIHFNNKNLLTHDKLFSTTPQISINFSNREKLIREAYRLCTPLLNQIDKIRRETDKEKEEKIREGLKKYRFITTEEDKESEPRTDSNPILFFNKYELLSVLDNEEEKSSITQSPRLIASRPKLKSPANSEFPKSKRKSEQFISTAHINEKLDKISENSELDILQTKMTIINDIKILIEIVSNQNVTEEQSLTATYLLRLAWNKLRNKWVNQPFSKEVLSETIDLIILDGFYDVELLHFILRNISIYGTIDQIQKLLSTFPKLETHFKTMPWYLSPTIYLEENAMNPETEIVAWLQKNIHNVMLLHPAIFLVCACLANNINVIRYWLEFLSPRVFLIKISGENKLVYYNIIDILIFFFGLRNTNADADIENFVNIVLNKSTDNKTTLSLLLNHSYGLTSLLKIIVPDETSVKTKHGLYFVFFFSGEAFKALKSKIKELVLTEYLKKNNKTLITDYTITLLIGLANTIKIKISQKKLPLIDTDKYLPFISRSLNFKIEDVRIESTESLYLLKSFEPEQLRRTGSDTDPVFTNHLILVLSLIMKEIDESYAMCWEIFITDKYLKYLSLGIIAETLLFLRYNHQKCSDKNKKIKLEQYRSDLGNAMAENLNHKIIYNELLACISEFNRSLESRKYKLPQLYMSLELFIVCIEHQNNDQMPLLQQLICSHNVKTALENMRIENVKDSYKLLKTIYKIRLKLRLNLKIYTIPRKNLSFLKEKLFFCSEQSEKEIPDEEITKVIAPSDCFKGAKAGGLREKLGMFRGATTLSTKQIRYIKSKESTVTIEIGKNRGGKRCFLLTGPLSKQKIVNKLIKKSREKSEEQKS